MAGDILHIGMVPAGVGAVGMALAGDGAGIWVGDGILGMV